MKINKIIYNVKKEGKLLLHRIKLQLKSFGKEYILIALITIVFFLSNYFLSTYCSIKDLAKCTLIMLIITLALSAYLRPHTKYYSHLNENEKKRSNFLTASLIIPLTVYFFIFILLLVLSKFNFISYQSPLFFNLLLSYVQILFIIFTVLVINILYKLYKKYFKTQS